MSALMTLLFPLLLIAQVPPAAAVPPVGTAGDASAAQHPEQHRHPIDEATLATSAQSEARRSRSQAPPLEAVSVKAIVQAHGAHDAAAAAAAVHGEAAGDASLRGSTASAAIASHERPAGEEEFIVDNDALQADSPGLAYRNSANLQDLSGGIYAAWGSSVRGVRVGRRWVKTSNGFLPTDVQGTAVLLPAHGHSSIFGGVFGGDSGIVKSETNRTWWGFPSYLRYMDTGLQSWEELARLHGHLGNMCTASNALHQCGTHLVCNDGICGECQLSRDCSAKYKCQYFSTSGRSMCVARVLSEQWTWREGVCTLLIIVTAMLSAAAGMGGGGVYVPLLLLLLDFSTQEAVPLSQAMIMGGATVNIIMFAGERHPKYPHRSKIDYDVIMMLNPGLAAGVTLGVMLNLMSPQWLIVVVLIITLVLALQKSLTKGIQQFKKESKLLEEQRQLANSSGGGGGGGAGRSVASGKAAVQVKLVDVNSFSELAASNARPITLILGCWVVFLACNLMKAEQCSGMYWLQLAFLLVLCFGFTAEGARTIVKQAAESTEASAEGVLTWTPQTLWLYPLLSTIAGFLGGFLGIGGGIIVGPLLLELGMAAEASQATTAMFVFLSSSLASIQFLVLGRAMPEFAVWFTTWVLLATFVGQTAIDYALKKYQRSSLIVLSVAAIIGGSLVMMSAIGSMDIIADIMRGAYMGFSPRNLCFA